MPQMIEGLWMTVVGMGTVFTVLIILYVIMVIMKMIFYKENKEVMTSNVKQESVSNVEDDYSDNMEEEELVAVLTAAIAANLNQSTYNLKIKSIRRIDKTSPVWNAVSRKEQIENML